MGALTDGGGADPDCCLAGANALAPDLMTAAERLDEIAEILARGLLRLRCPKPSTYQRNLEKNGLDFSPGRSVHATARQRREARR